MWLLRSSKFVSKDPITRGVLPAVVHIVDDDESFRTSLVRVLTAAGYSVVEYSSGETALKSILRNETRGCVLLDVRMPGIGGIELQERLAERSLPIVFMSGYSDLPTTVKAIKAGAEDFLVKPIGAQELFNTIERALGRYDRERAAAGRTMALLALMSKLTQREQEVLDLVVLGRLNKQIAFELGTSERTVKAHRHNIMAKLQVSSVAELVTFVDQVKIAKGTGPRKVQ
jgi:FixJ family two-component response regulator